MTDAQRAAHHRMLATLPVHTVRRFNAGGPEVSHRPVRAERQHGALIINRRFSSLKIAAESLRVSQHTLRDWITKYKWGHFE